MTAIQISSASAQVAHAYSPYLSIIKMAAPHREAIQKQIQQDWANREYIEVITISIKKITDFLNSFGKFFAVQHVTNLYGC